LRPGSAHRDLEFAVGRRRRRSEEDEEEEEEEEQVTL